MIARGEVKVEGGDRRPGGGNLDREPVDLQELDQGPVDHRGKLLHEKEHGDSNTVLIMLDE
ncbi:hypothetical protein OSTOST_22199, partial [Ostertagia ostertagi]